jgi:hypothetical protein
LKTRVQSEQFKLAKFKKKHQLPALETARQKVAPPICKPKSHHTHNKRFIWYQDIVTPASKSTHSHATSPVYNSTGNCFWIVFPFNAWDIHPSTSPEQTSLARPRVLLQSSIRHSKFRLQSWDSCCYNSKYNKPYQRHLGQRLFPQSQQMHFFRRPPYPLIVLVKEKKGAVRATTINLGLEIYDVVGLWIERVLDGIRFFYLIGNRCRQIFQFLYRLGFARVLLNIRFHIGSSRRCGIHL